MNKIDGYIDVDKMLYNIGITDTNIYNLKYESQINILSLKYSGIVLSFSYENEKYFYKCNHNIIPYNELIAEEFARDFGIDCVTYSLATLNGKRGVISSNYKQDNIDYISGSELLYDLYSRINGNYKLNGDDLDKYNNLESIWDALEYRYRDKSNNREIVSSLMNQIVNMFIFDLIVCNYDRHSDNWEIMECGNEVRLAPIYDNEGILTTSGKNAFVSMTFNEENREILWKTLINFQKVSSREFSNIIKEKLWIISEENLNKIFTRIEVKTGCAIPDIYKKHYIEEYQSHLKRLEKTLGINDEINRKR